MRAESYAQHDRLLFAAEVYRHYAALMCEGPHGLGGRLLLAADEPEERAGAAQPAEPDVSAGGRAAPAEALIRAANIAGAASLLVTPDTGLAQERVRGGVCDFLVTNLDEALRILKNEIRRKLAAAVCLLADPAGVLDECVERGVQPDLLATFRSANGSAQALAERGARLLPGRLDSFSLEWREANGTVLRLASWTLPPPSTRLLASVDALVRDALEPYAHAERLRWLARAPQYLGRTLTSTHTVPLAPSEAGSLAQVLAIAIREERVPCEISLRYGDETLLGY